MEVFTAEQHISVAITHRGAILIARCSNTRGILRKNTPVEFARESA